MCTTECRNGRDQKKYVSGVGGFYVCQSGIAKLNVSRAAPAEHDPAGSSTQHAYFSRDNRRRAAERGREGGGEGGEHEGTDGRGRGTTHYCIVQFDRIPKSFRFCDAATRGA